MNSRGGGGLQNYICTLRGGGDFVCTSRIFPTLIPHQY